MKVIYSFLFMGFILSATSIHAMECDEMIGSLRPYPSFHWSPETINSLPENNAYAAQRKQLYQSTFPKGLYFYSVDANTKWTCPQKQITIVPQMPQGLLAKFEVQDRIELSPGACAPTSGPIGGPNPNCKVVTRFQDTLSLTSQAVLIGIAVGSAQGIAPGAHPFSVNVTADEIGGNIHIAQTYNITHQQIDSVKAAAITGGAVGIFDGKLELWVSAQHNVSKAKANSVKVEITQLSTGKKLRRNVGLPKMHYSLGEAFNIKAPASGKYKVDLTLRHKGADVARTQFDLEI